jgi:hypothetical protein
MCLYASGMRRFHCGSSARSVAAPIQTAPLPGTSLNRSMPSSFFRPPHSSRRTAKRESVSSGVLNCADIVGKVFLGGRTKFPRTADALRIRRCEGPHCFPRKRPRTLASAMQSVAAVELSRNLLSRYFWRCSIFDVCNNIGTERTWRSSRCMSAIGATADDIVS